MVPTITVPMEGSTILIKEGSSSTIDCTVAGFPLPRVVWEKVDGSDLGNSLSIADPVINITTNTVSVSLIITNVSREDSGEYRCLADNSTIVGTANRAVYLIVQCKSSYICTIC